MDKEDRCSNCGALQNKKSHKIGECWKCELSYKVSEVNGDGVLVEDNTRGVFLGHDIDEDKKADISFKCSYCDIEVSEKLSDGNHTYWHEACNRTTRIIVTHGYMRHRELIEDDSTESEVSKAKLKQLKLKLDYLKLRQRKIANAQKKIEEEPVNENDVGTYRESQKSSESQTFDTFKKIGSYLRFSLISSRRITIALILSCLFVIAYTARYEYLEIGTTAYPTVMRVDRWTNKVSIYVPKEGRWLSYDMKGAE